MESGEPQVQASPLADDFHHQDACAQKDVPEPLEGEYREVAWSIPSWGSAFAPIWINRPAVGDHDVKFEMKFCGVCHSDCHLGLNHLTGTTYPIVPGHELVGTVVEVGPQVTTVKVGDNVGVGCMIDSCLNCDTCAAGDEIRCEAGGSLHTYNTFRKYGHNSGNPETQTFGGYSGSNVVHEHFIFKIPDAVPLEAAGPLLCAGITMFDPLVHWKAYEYMQSGKQMCVGVVGIGGLGTMGLKLAKAMGHRVVAISNSPNKEQMCKDKGADAFVCATDNASLAAEAGKCDLILNTVSADHQVMHYVPLLRHGGTIVQLGLVIQPHDVQQLPLMFARKSIAGSCIGGTVTTRLMLDFCAEKGILPDVQLIEAKEIDWAWQQLTKTSNGDGIRYVIDVKKSLENPDFVPQ